MSFLIALILLGGFLIVLSVGLVSVIFDLSKMSCHAPPEAVPHEGPLDLEQRGMNAVGLAPANPMDLHNS
jgi:hypothetical protein